MNAEQKWPEKEREEPDIILIGIDRKSYYLYKGEAHLDQLLLADGEFPRPVLCIHFKRALDAKLVIGQAVNIAQMWGIHPEIVKRLRNDEHLIETDA